MKIRGFYKNFRNIYQKPLNIMVITLLLACTLTITGEKTAWADESLWSTQAAYASGGSGGGMTLDVRGADMRDVLSALAMKMGVSIILLGTEPIEVNFKADNVTPLMAMELIIQSKGLSYIQKADMMVVGPPDLLQKDFFDKMMLTRFDTQYIKTDKLKEMLTELGIQGISSVITDANPNVIWAQGTAEGMKKIREVIASVDIPEQTIEDEKTRFVYQLTYIVAEDAAQRLAKFGFKDLETITTDGDRYGHEIMVICPKKIETQVKSALNSLDMPRQKTKAPVLTAKGEYAHQALVSSRDLLAQISDVSISSMSISRNLGTSYEPVHVLWVEEAPDKIRKLKDLVTEMRLEELTSDQSDGKDDKN